MQKNLSQWLDVSIQYMTAFMIMIIINHHYFKRIEELEKTEY